MNVIARGSNRYASRALVRVTRRSSHDESLDPIEAARDLKFWKTVTWIGVAVLAGFFAKIQLYGAHEVPGEIKYDYLAIRNKPFAWGSGKDSLWENIFGKPHQGHH
eukprot:TRINITY_DN445_c0_g1_i1.p1 TRINITY_DN445_c0_g1~~TRINITY_DN445_c0_g1_i1.p1  ORF type:complete len:106 (-),score=0.47 TRINITY_DN445_c0_g1_i1:98-415(-)